MNTNTWELYDSIKEAARKKLVFLGEGINDDAAMEIISEMVINDTKGTTLSLDEKLKLKHRIFNSIRRLGVLQPIIDDKSISEIMINGPDNIFVERGRSVVKIEDRFDSQEDLMHVINEIVKVIGREVNQNSPIADARLSDGSRVNIVLPPISLVGPVVTIRKFPDKAMTMEQLLRWGAITKEAAEVLRKLVIAKYNIFIAGGTGSGKTTFLNALSNYIPQNERIITIEDSAELQIVNIPNLISLETREATSSGGKEINIRALIKSSLRMRPNRIVVGEVRGAEALDMLQAMNTGHDGSLSTGHANSTRDMISRLETMVLSGADFPLQAVRQQIASAIEIIVHLGRMRDGSRRVLEISEIKGLNGEEIEMNSLYRFEENEERTLMQVRGSLNKKNDMIHTEKLKNAGIDIM